MLHFHGFLPSLIKLHQSSLSIPGFPYKWTTDKKGRKRVKVSKQTRWKGWFAVMLLVIGVNVLSQRVYKQENNATKFTLGLVSLTGQTISTGVLWSMSVNAESTVQFLNGLMEVERILHQKGIFCKYTCLDLCMP